MRFKFCLHFSMNTTVKACFLKGVLHSKNIGKMTFTEKLCFEVNVMKAKRLIYLQNHIQLFMISYSSFHLFVPITYWLCPRPISNSQLHALLHFHLCPIYLVVFKGSYNLRWDISS